MPRHLSLEFERNKTSAERLTDRIVSLTGSLPFVALHAVFFGSWVAVNALHPRGWDPYPFNLLTLVVSLEAIFLSTFVLIVQNREAKRTDLRSQLDYEVDMKAEGETKQILNELKAVRRELEELKRHRL